MSSFNEIDFDSLPKSQQSLFIVCCDEDHSEALAAINIVHKQQPLIRSVVLSHRLVASNVVAALEAGAHGYLLKSTSCEALIKSLELVRMGEIIVPSEYLRMVSNLEPRIQQSNTPLIPKTANSDEPIDYSCDENVRKLSDRESVVLRHLMQGDANKLIARQLGIADATVKVHIKAILRKIRVNNRTQAALWAVEHAEHVAALPRAPKAVELDVFGGDVVNGAPRTALQPISRSQRRRLQSRLNSTSAGVR